jgi:hypothetical protein
MSVLDAPLKMLAGKPEPVRAIRIHLRGAVIHTTFTSLTSICDLRRDDTAYAISTFGAGAISENPRRIHMQVTKVLGLAAVGALLVLAAPTERAQALSLSNPGAATAVQQDAKPATTEVRWWRHRHHRWHRRHWRR